MKFIIGLRNPGKKYSRTRHNIGFTILDSFAEKRSLKWKEFKDNEIISDDNSFLLIKPMLFMNLSGSAVSPLVKKYNPDCEDILVIHDDLDIDFERINVKKSGSSGGHNGVQSIIDLLGTKELDRLRIGIGRPPEFIDPVDFVLSNFDKKEMDKLDTIINRAVDAAEVFVESDIQKTMNL